MRHTLFAATSLLLTLGVACDETATTTPNPSGSCGDGVVVSGEACDDGNTTDGDGCSATCQLEGQGGATTTGGGGEAGGGGDGGTAGAGGDGGSGGIGGAGGAPPISCDYQVTFVSPEAESFVGPGGSVSAAVTIVDPNSGQLDNLLVQWEDNAGTVLANASAVDTNGFSNAIISPGAPIGSLHARVLTPQGQCEETVSRRLLVCGSSIEESFDVAVDPATWTVFGDASWNTSGWLDMTALAQNQHGAIYNTQDLVTGGNVSIRFNFLTGGGTNPGADGLAFTVIEAAQPSDLDALVAAAHDGGGLGYGVGGTYGSFSGDAFSLEIDTWYNQFNGSTELHTDPTAQAHLEITQGADPGNSLTFAPVAGVQDQQWHSIRADIVGSHIRVYFDGSLAIDLDDNQLQFKGGRAFFSGSTGFYYNFHRFDDLAIYHACD